MPVRQWPYRYMLALFRALALRGVKKRRAAKIAYSFFASEIVEKDGDFSCFLQDVRLTHFRLKNYPGAAATLETRSNKLRIEWKDYTVDDVNWLQPMTKMFQLFFEVPTIQTIKCVREFGEAANEAEFVEREVVPMIERSLPISVHFLTR